MGRIVRSGGPQDARHESEDAMAGPKQWRPHGADPTPAEIARRAAAIRRRWDGRTLLERQNLVPKRRRTGRLLWSRCEVDYGAYDDEWLMLTREEQDPRDAVLPRLDLLSKQRGFDDDRAALLSGECDL